MISTFCTVFNCYLHVHCQVDIFHIAALSQMQKCQKHFDLDQCHRNIQITLGPTLQCMIMYRLFPYHRCFTHPRKRQHPTKKLSSVQNTTHKKFKCVDQTMPLHMRLYISQISCYRVITEEGSSSGFHTRYQLHECADFLKGMQQMLAFL